MKCPKCGGRMTEMLFSVSCDAKCDQPKESNNARYPGECLALLHGQVHGDPQGSGMYARAWRTDSGALRVLIPEPMMIASVHPSDRAEVINIERDIGGAVQVERGWHLTLTTQNSGGHCVLTGLQVDYTES